MRALVQSTESGRFLARAPDSGCAVWVRSLRDALATGIVEDEEHLAQLVEDYCDLCGFIVVDLDNIPEGL